MPYSLHLSLHIVIVRIETSNKCRNINDRSWRNPQLTFDRFLEFCLFRVFSEMKDDPVVRSKGEHTDVGPVETDIEGFDGALHEVQLLGEVRAPDAAGLIQYEHEVRRIVTTPYKQKELHVGLCYVTTPCEHNGHVKASICTKSYVKSYHIG